MADICDVGEIPPAPMTLKQFTGKIQQLRESDELGDALSLPAHEFNSYLAQFVPCVGCRRWSVELLFIEVLLILLATFFVVKVLSSVEKLYTDIGQLNYDVKSEYLL